MKQYLTPKVLAALQSLPTTEAPTPTSLATTPEELHQRATQLDPTLAELPLDAIEAQLAGIYDDDTWTQQQLPQVPAEVAHRYIYVYVNQELLG